MGVGKWTEETVNNPSFSTSSEEIINPPAPNWTNEAIQQEVTLVSDRIPTSLPLRFVEGGHYDVDDGLSLGYSGGTTQFLKPVNANSTLTVSGSYLTLSATTKLIIGDENSLQWDNPTLYIGKSNNITSLVIGGSTINDRSFELFSNTVTITGDSLDSELRLINKNVSTPGRSNSIIFQNNTTRKGGITYNQHSTGDTMFMGAGVTDYGSGTAIPNKVLSISDSKVGIGIESGTMAALPAKFTVRDSTSGGAILQSSGLTSGCWRTSVDGSNNYIFEYSSTETSLGTEWLSISNHEVTMKQGQLNITSELGADASIEFRPNNETAEDKWRLQAKEDGSQFSIGLWNTGTSVFDNLWEFKDDKSTTIPGGLYFSPTEYLNADINNIFNFIQTDTGIAAKFAILTVAANTDQHIRLQEGASTKWRLSSLYNSGTRKFAIGTGYAAAFDSSMGSTLGADNALVIDATSKAIETGIWQASQIDIAYGGTNATTASDARTNLGLEIGTDVMAQTAIDPAPVNGSTNLVESDGIYDAIQLRVAQNIETYSEVTELNDADKFFVRDYADPISSSAYISTSNMYKTFSRWERNFAGYKTNNTSSTLYYTSQYGDKYWTSSDSSLSTISITTHPLIGPFTRNAEIQRIHIWARPYAFGSSAPFDDFTFYIYKAARATSGATQGSLLLVASYTASFTNNGYIVNVGTSGVLDGTEGAGGAGVDNHISEGEGIWIFVKRDATTNHASMSHYFQINIGGVYTE